MHEGCKQKLIILSNVTLADKLLFIMVLFEALIYVSYVVIQLSSFK